MADKLISQLGARAAVLTTDLMPLEPIAGPPAEKAAVSQLVTLLNTIYAPITGGAYVLKAGDTMTGLLTIAQATANTSILTSTGYSLTGANAQNMLDFAGTWNTSGTPTAFKISITNTASNASSKLMELLAGAAGATSMFSIGRLGQAVFASGTLASGSLALSFLGSPGTGWYENLANQWTFVTTGGTPNISLISSFIRLQSVEVVCWGTGNSTTSADIGIGRNGVGILEVNSGAAGTFRDLKLRALTMATAGLLSITSGSNQRAGNLTLVGGTLTVANTTVTANTMILLTRKATGGTIGFAVTYTLIASTSFTVTSDNVLDTSTYSYLLIEVP